MAWNSDAIVWLNDEHKGSVLVGPYGFAWRKASKVFVAVFDEKSSAPVGAYQRFTAWSTIKMFNAADADISVVTRFVRTGLLPASAKTG